MFCFNCFCADVVMKEVVEIEKCIEMPIDKSMVVEVNGNQVNRLPELRDGGNERFLFASAAIDLRLI